MGYETDITPPDLFVCKRTNELFATKALAEQIRGVGGCDVGVVSSSDIAASVAQAQYHCADGTVVSDWASCPAQPAVGQITITDLSPATTENVPVPAVSGITITSPAPNVIVVTGSPTATTPATITPAASTNPLSTFPGLDAIVTWVSNNALYVVLGIIALMILPRLFASSTRG